MESTIEASALVAKHGENNGVASLDVPPSAASPERNNWSLQRRWRIAVVGGLPICGALLAALSNNLGAAELIGGVIGLLAGFAIVRFRVACFVAVAGSAALGIAAIFGPAYRGTYRWLMLSDGRSINMALPIFAVVIAALVVRHGEGKRGWFWMGGMLLLLAMNAYILATLMFAVGAWRFAQTRWLVCGVIGLALCVAIASNANRRARLSEFFEARSYHSKQVQRTVAKLNFIGAADGRQVHLPAAKTDLALLHAARVLGILPAAAYLVMFVAAQRLTRSASAHASPARHAFFLPILWQIGCLAGCLPVVGMPVPFLAAGGSQWFASCLMLPLLIPPARQPSDQIL